jgi:hypothetical protein
MDEQFAPGPWTYNHPAQHVWNIRDANGSLIAVYHGANSDANPQNEATARLLAAAPALYAALRTLVSADNVNYARDTMRYEGLFDAGRKALRGATGWPPCGHLDDSPIWTPAESAPALRDMLSQLTRTVNDTLRHGMTPAQIEKLDELTRRAGKLLNETPSNE